MIIKRIEEWSHLELEEVATGERREMGEMITMKSSRVTKEDMGTEKQIKREVER